MNNGPRVTATGTTPASMTSLIDRIRAFLREGKTGQITVNVKGGKPMSLDIRESISLSSN